MPRFLFLTLAADAPSSRIRVSNLLPVLREHGVEAQERVLPRRTGERFRLFRQARQFDGVYLQKKFLSLVELGLLRRFAPRLVFDFDDAIYCRDAACSGDPSDYRHPGRERRVRRMARSADHVVVANQELARVSRRLCPETPVTVIPSAVETDPVPGKANYDTLAVPPVLGWVGSGGTQKYLVHAREALLQIGREVPFELCVVSDRKPDLPGVTVRLVPWSLEGQYQSIAGFDVGIMPLSADPFSRGKAAYKLLQYLSVGVPSVCSAVGMNVEVSAGNTHCLAAGDNAEFAAAVLRLLRDCSLRRQLGQAGRAYVRERFSIAAVGERLAVTLTAVARAGR